MPSSHLETTADTGVIKCWC